MWTLVFFNPMKTRSLYHGNHWIQRLPGNFSSAKANGPSSLEPRNPGFFGTDIPLRFQYTMITASKFWWCSHDMMLWWIPMIGHPLEMEVSRYQKYGNLTTEIESDWTTNHSDFWWKYSWRQCNNGISWGIIVIIIIITIIIASGDHIQSMWRFPKMGEWGYPYIIIHL